MRTAFVLGTFVAASVLAVSCAETRPSTSTSEAAPTARGVDRRQIPTWTDDDVEFYLHGSLGTEVVPERVLAAFRATYPDLFPGSGFAAFGLIETPGDLPVGLSRREVPHLGGLASLGINCAACHTTEIRQAMSASEPVRVLGATGHFDAEAFLGAVTIAEFRCMDPTNMGNFLGEYLHASDPTVDVATRMRFAADLERQKPAIAAAIADDPGGGKGVAPGALQPIAPEDVALDGARVAAGVDLARSTRSFLRLFHNMRAALHIPDAIPKVLPPASGPGRNDAFGLLSFELFQSPTDYAPVKYGVLWNLEGRPWVHWDGNTRSALGRNILAALGLGAPMAGKRADLDLALVRRHTEATEKIRPPAFPWALDMAAAERGRPIYSARCASCHDAPDSDVRLHDLKDIGTDPSRARSFDAPHAELFNGFFRELQLAGFESPKEAPIRSTGKYWTPMLAGVWARSPYLHNGSVRTIADLLTSPASRPKSFRRGSIAYDLERMGFLDDGPYLLDSTTPGNGNGGHDYGTDLDAAGKRDLIEYLKTL